MATYFGDELPSLERGSLPAAKIPIAQALPAADIRDKSARTVFRPAPVAQARIDLLTSAQPPPVASWILDGRGFDRSKLTNQDDPTGPQNESIFKRPWFIPVVVGAVGLLGLVAWMTLGKKKSMAGYRRRR